MMRGDIEISGNIQWRKDHTQARYHDHSRPDGLPRGNIEVELRHPEIAGGEPKAIGSFAAKSGSFLQLRYRHSVAQALHPRAAKLVGGNFRGIASQ
jgi:hypothetical protein